MQPHQERVVTEKTELDAKRDKLTEFQKGTIFPKLPPDEQSRLKRQAEIMEAYSSVLAERIAAFGNCTSAET